MAQVTSSASVVHIPQHGTLSIEEPERVLKKVKVYDVSNKLISAMCRILSGFHVKG